MTFSSFRDASPLHKLLLGAEKVKLVGTEQPD